MPRKRQTASMWRQTRRVIWFRDGERCVHCKKPVTLYECHIDHIVSGRMGTNRHSNLRTLCPRCHYLRGDFRHRGMTAAAIASGIIPADWRRHVWWDP